MKKLVITFTTVLISLTSVIADDDKNAKHNVGIEIPEIALVDVEDAQGHAGTINLSPNVSELEAGEAIDFSAATDNSLWLNYTSVIKGNNGNGNGSGNGGQKRKVTAKIESSDLPESISLLLQVGETETGSGNLGNAIDGTIKLDDKDKNIVTNIGSCYTESGAQKGHQLTYSVEMNNSDFDELIAKSYTAEILYTITDK